MSLFNQMKSPRKLLKEAIVPNIFQVRALKKLQATKKKKGVVIMGMGSYPCYADIVEENFVIEHAGDEFRALRDFLDEHLYCRHKTPKHRNIALQVFPPYRSDSFASLVY